MPFVIVAFLALIAYPAYLLYNEIEEFLEEENMNFREFVEMMKQDARS
jgi:Tfp pilus assembly protein PilE